MLSKWLKVVNEASSRVDCVKGDLFNQRTLLSKAEFKSSLSVEVISWAKRRVFNCPGCEFTTVPETQYCLLCSLAGFQPTCKSWFILCIIEKSLKRHYVVFVMLPSCNVQPALQSQSLSMTPTSDLKKSSCGRSARLRNSGKDMTTAQPCVVQWAFAEEATLELSVCCSEMNAVPRYSSGGNKLFMRSRKALFETFMYVGVCAAERLSTFRRVVIRSCRCITNYISVEKSSGCLSHTFARKKGGTKVLWRWWWPFRGFD